MKHMSVFMLEIITPEKLFLKQEVEALSCKTVDGELGILKGHQPMAAAVEIGELRFKINSEWKSAFNSEGFLEVRPDEVLIFVQSCEWPEDIDVARAKAAKLRAESKLQHIGSISEQKINRISLVRAMTRLRLSEKNEKNHIF